MPKRLFVILSALSLLVGIALTVLWGRSYFVCDQVHRSHNNTITTVTSVQGCLGLTIVSVSQPNGGRVLPEQPWRWHAVTSNRPIQWPTTPNPWCRLLGLHWGQIGEPILLGHTALTRTTCYWSLAYGLPILLTAILPALWIWRACTRLRHSDCPAGASSSARPIIPEATGQVASIVHDLPCVHCAYNLRTLPTTARCPECGALVQDTLTLNAQLAQSRPGWLRCLAAGNLLLLLVRLLAVAMLLVLAAHDRFAALSCFALMGVLYLTGTVLLTLREHPYLSSPHRKTALWQRALALASLLCAGVALVCQIPSPAGRWAAYSWDPLVLTLLLAAWLLYCVSMVLEYRFLATLAGRLLDRFMSEHCMIAGIGAALTGLPAIWIVPVLGTWDGLLMGPAAYTGLVAVTVLWVLFVLWTAFMNVYCAIRFTRQAHLAAARWQAQAQTPPV